MRALYGTLKKAKHADSDRYREHETVVKELARVRAIWPGGIFCLAVWLLNQSRAEAKKFTWILINSWMNTESASVHSEWKGEGRGDSRE